MSYFQFLIIIFFSPLVNGVIKKLKANMQGRVGAGVLQPYYDLLRLFRKGMVVSRVTSWIFTAAPYVVFTSAAAAALLVPVVTTQSVSRMMGPGSDFAGYGEAVILVGSSAVLSETATPAPPPPPAGPPHRRVRQWVIPRCATPRSNSTEPATAKSPCRGSNTPSVTRSVRTTSGITKLMSA